MRIYEGSDLTETKTFNFPFSNLYYYLNYGHTPGNLYVQKINPLEYNPIDISFKDNKLYLFEDKIVFSFEIENKSTKTYKTKLISINLNNYEIDQNNIDYEIKKDDVFNINSFLLDSILIQEKINNEEIILSFKDIKNDKLIDEKKLSKVWHKEVSFYSFKRKLYTKKSNDALLNGAFKKMNTQFSALSAYRRKHSNSILLFVGAYTPQNNYSNFNNQDIINDRLVPNLYNTFKERNLFNAFKKNYSFYYKLNYDFNNEEIYKNDSKNSAMDEMIKYSLKFSSNTSEFYYKKQDYYIFGSFNPNERIFRLCKFVE